MASIHKLRNKYTVRCCSPRFGRITCGNYVKERHAEQVVQIIEYRLRGTKKHPVSYTEKIRIKRIELIEEIDLFRASLGLRRVTRNT